MNKEHDFLHDFPSQAKALKIGINGDISVGQMLELILMHSFENRPCFGKVGLETVKGLKRVYGLNYNVHDYEKFIDGQSNQPE